MARAKIPCPKAAGGDAKDCPGPCLRPSHGRPRHKRTMTEQNHNETSSLPSG